MNRKHFTRRNIGILLCVIILSIIVTRCFVGAPDAKPTQQSVLTVTSVTPLQQNWPQNIQASGALAAWQEAVIDSEVTGMQVTSIAVDVGSIVTKGQILAELSTDSTMADWHKQTAQVAIATANLAEAKDNGDRARKIEKSGALSKQQIESYLIAEQTATADLDSANADLENTNIILEKSHIRAIDDGVITSRSATLGQVVSSGTELFRLQRQNRVEWNAEVDAEQWVKIKADQIAHITLSDGTTITGQVRVVAPSLNASTGRAIVYVTLPQHSGALAGSFASGQIELGKKTALTVPQSAIVLQDGRAYVFKINANNTVSRKVVTTGRYYQDRVEVLNGVNVEDRLVAAGGAFLSDGSIVTVTKTQPEASA